MHFSIRFNDFAAPRARLRLTRRPAICLPADYEVGGPDTALITSMGNLFANLPGIGTTWLGTIMLQRTGSLLPVFVFSGALQLLCGLFFTSSAETTAARELLAAKAR